MFESTRFAWLFTFRREAPHRQAFSFELKGCMSEEIVSEMMYAKKWDMYMAGRHWILWGKPYEDKKPAFRSDFDDQIIQSLKRQRMYSLIILSLWAVLAWRTGIWRLGKAAWVASLCITLALVYNVLRESLYMAMVQVRDESPGLVR